MRRIWIPVVVAGAAVVGVLVFLAIRKEATDEESRAAIPPPAECEPDARDLNPADDPVEPVHDRRLIPRERGHLPVGFNDSAYLTGQLDLEQSLALYENMDASIWRLPLDWGEVESEPGEIDFSKYDPIYCAAIDAGVRPLWHLTGIPPWAAPLGTCDQVPCVRPPESEHLPQLERFAEIAAVRYPRSAAFEAWNEPNLTGFWGGAPNPGDYLPILEAVYTGTKNGNPDMPVLGGALSNNMTDTAGGNQSLETYLTAILDGGAANHMDGFSLHAYPVAPLGEDGDAFTPALDVTRSALADAGAEMQTWVTEVGAPTEAGVFPEVTPEQQADMMADAYGVLDASADVDAVVFHTLVDPTSDVPGGLGFGFFTAPDEGTVTAKPVVCRILALSGAAAECPSGPLAL
jgi:hypothetical protein